MAKYTPDNLIPALRLFIEARNNAVDSGFTDNGGAIHSVERILDILSQRLCFAGLTHTNHLKKSTDAEISVAAHAARIRGENIFIEHVLPQRAYAKEIIARVAKGSTDDELIKYIRENYRLVLLTDEETKRINRSA